MVKRKIKYPLLYGFGLTVGISFLALKLSKAPVWPLTIEGGRHPLGIIILSILLGLVLGNIWALPEFFKSGIKFSVKKLLPLGVILLGARLDFGDLLSVGAIGLLMSACEVIFAMLLLLFLAKKFHLPPKLGLLLGVGTAICGGTAIVAVAPIIKARDDEVVISVATVTLLGLISMLIMPVIGSYFALDSHSFGIWTGLTIHQTPQVIAAGFAYSPEAGETATIIKLARVCLLAPVAFLIGLYWNRSETSDNSNRLNARQYFGLVPTFILGFMAMALVRTLGLFPEFQIPLQANYDFNLSTQSASIAGAKYSLAAAMAGVGLETRFASLKTTSLKSFLVAGGGAMLITILGLAAVIWLI